MGIRERIGAEWRRLATEGPSLSIVALVFVVIQTLSFGYGSPATGLEVLALGLLFAFIALLAERRGADEPVGPVHRFSGTPRLPQPRLPPPERLRRFA